MEWIYLDNNATTKPAPAVVAAMDEMLGSLWGNPSSVHRFGQQVRQRIELARASVASLIGARDRQIVFTSGGTESNNLALRGTLLGTPPAGAAGGARKRVLVTTPIEHSAIREPAEQLDAWGIAVEYLPVAAQGWIDPASASAALEQHADAELVLLSVQWANNETGVIQPIAALADVVAAARQAGRKVLLHVDATQAVGKAPVDVAGTVVDLMTMSAHKFHGPKGVGALYLRAGVRVRPQNVGGPQERERRGGTENVPGIVGMGVAAQLAQQWLAAPEEVERQRALRDRFEAAVQQRLPSAVINAPRAGDGVTSGRLWNTSNIAFPNLEAEAILLGLSERGVCASAGAACSSGSLEPSPILRAMGIPETLAHGSVRFSLSRETTPQEVEEAAERVADVVERLGRTLPLGHGS